MEKKLDGNYTRMLHTILNKSWRQHPRKTAAVWPLIPHLKNYASKMNKTHGTLIEKQRWTYKWYSPMDPYTWICQCWSTSKNLYQLSVQRLNVVWKTCWEWWRIEMDGKRVREICAVSITWWWNKMYFLLNGISIYAYVAWNIFDTKNGPQGRKDWGNLV